MLIENGFLADTNNVNLGETYLQASLTPELEDTQTGKILNEMFLYWITAIFSLLIAMIPFAFKDHQLLRELNDIDSGIYLMAKAHPGGRNISGIDNG